MINARLYKAKDIQSADIPPQLLEQKVDLEYFIFDTFGIDEARNLKIRAYQKPAVRETCDFIIQFKSITTEAQNALLKLLEDPPETSIFHIVVQREDILLPTLRSRLLLCSSDQNIIERDEIRAFLKLNYPDRMTEIAKRIKAKDTDWIESIIAGAEEFVNIQKQNSHRRNLMQSIVFVRQYIGRRGAANKMLLEELAMNMPLIHS